MRRPLLASIAVCVGLVSLAAGEFGDVPRLLQDARGRAEPLPEPEGRDAGPEPDGGVWVSFDRADLGPGFPLSHPAIQNDSVAVFRVDESALPGLSRYMHEHFKRCGGFFAHGSRAEAEKDLASPAAASGAAPSYTIDQQARARPLIARTQEKELRSTIEALSALRTRYYSSETGEAAARWLQGRWQGLAKRLPGASVQLVSHQGWRQPSVVLTVPGTERPDEIVVLGGHLDSINLWGEESPAPGADDNASGIAVLTEAVRILSQAGFRPRRTVQFMGYAAEEVGLLGSQEIAKKYSGAGKKVIGVLQFDMTNFQGSGDGLFFLSDNVDAELTAFLGRLADAYVGAPWSTIRCGYACSDHASWSREGFPASAAFESKMEAMNPRIHTEDDTLANAGSSAAHSLIFAKLAVAFAVETAKTARPFHN